MNLIKNFFCNNEEVKKKNLKSQMMILKKEKRNLLTGHPKMTIFST